MESLHLLRSTDPPNFLNPTRDLSQLSRSASQFLFDSLKPHTPKSPFDRLLVDGFDAEQIWQQIDLQTQPLIHSLKREIKRFEKDPDRILKDFDVGSGKNDDLEENLGIEKDDEDDDDEDMQLIEEEKEEDEEEENDDDDDDDEDEEEERGGEGGIEDKFLNIEDMKRYLEEDEAREYGTGKKGAKKEEEEDDDEEDDDADEEDEEDERLGFFGADDENEEDELGNARYEDFFAKKKKTSTSTSKKVDDAEDSAEEDERKGDKKKENLSTYEKLQEKLHAEIEEMEKANLEPKDWTMTGEVTATKRPKNSALEVDLEFEHNARPPPLITEEDTIALEDLIKKRVLEGNFDDVRRPPKLPLKAPKEVKELDDNKSKKGLAELFEGDYARQNGFISAPQSHADLLKKEASVLFKRLCLKLDALSHFHFAPKPVVEEMAIPKDIPAYVMEEVAPVAVSDAAMLAPEEVFAGKGDIKGEAELTKSDRKQKRAKKKRKFKAQEAKGLVKKARYTTPSNNTDDKVSSP